MRKIKRGLSLLLTLLMLVSVMTVAAAADAGTGDVAQEPGTVDPQSMMPIEYHWVSIDMTGYLPNELKAVPLSVIKEKAGIEGNIAAWSFYDTGVYHLVTPETTLDLSPDDYDTCKEFEFIVGTADQLSLNNVRYIVSVDISGSMIGRDIDVSMVNADREPVVVSTSAGRYSTRYSGSSEWKQVDYVNVTASRQDWTFGEDAWFGLSFSEDSPFAALDVKVYKGFYWSLEEIPEDANDVTASVWNQADLTVEGGIETTGGTKGFTLVFSRDGVPVQALPFDVRIWESSVGVYGFSYIYKDGARAGKYRTFNYIGGVHSEEFMLYSGYSVNDTYSYTMGAWTDDPKAEVTSGVDLIEKAVVGNYKTAEDIPEDAENIKDQLFSDAGYEANFSEYVYFTIVSTDGSLIHRGVKVIEYEENTGSTASKPEPNSSDTYFRMRGAYNTDRRSILSYVMPYEADSYYYNGFQTVFLVNRTYDSTIHDYVYSPITDETIVPNFFTGNKVTMYAGHGGAAGTKQVSGETAIPFESGVTVQYSAAAENGANLKNYWVTFLTQQEGAKLFVNGTNDESHYYTYTDETTGEEVSMPQREVFLNDYYGYHHDVFFANIGADDINGLYVRLEDAENIAIDEYWTIGETTTLSPLTTTDEHDSYGGELANIGKIRLVPATDENGNELDGDISGTLVIGYTGDEEHEGEEVRIHLTGVAGNPKITTESVVEGVKYVPYSCVIQTNNMYDSGAVTFKLTGGTLPDGFVLKPNGELYGVPKTTGTFDFTVSITYNGIQCDTAAFTLVINENTDENVLATNEDDQGYTLLDAVPGVIDKGSIGDTELMFRSEGTYGDFMAFYLDGVKLVEGEDYDSSEGSTKITIRSQTFANLNNGTHTIAAEFRENADEDGIMKRTAQNLTITGSTPAVSTPAFDLTLNCGEGGQAELSLSKAYPGTMIFVTVTPDYGYAVESVTAGTADVTALEDGRYCFRMPYGSTEVVVTFKPAEADPETGLPFFDVHVGDWFLDHVRYVYENGIMQGTLDNAFAPNMDTTRGMIVTVLYRLAGEPEVSGTHSFEDVAAGAYYENAVIWAQSRGITDGTSDTTFSPDENITREQLAAMLYRYFGKPETSGSIEEFGDAALVSDWALEAMRWAVETGIYEGRDQNLLAPLGLTTRAETATVAERLANMEK